MHSNEVADIPAIADTVLEKKFDAMTLAMAVEKRIINSTGVSYMDAIIEFCDENDLDPSAAGALVKKIPALKAKLEAECRKLKLVEREKSSSNTINFE